MVCTNDVAPARANYRRSTLAWPLSWIYMALIIYASWYPLSGWQQSEQSALLFVTLSFPRYWTGFDIVTNIVGYIPLGFLWGLSALRMKKGWGAMMAAAGLITLLSFTMEWGQNYLPMRIPSNLDWFLNILGGVLGIFIAWLMEVFGAVARWSQFRRQWFRADTNAALALLLLWPFALLFPTPVAFAPGQVLERLFNKAAVLLFNTGWISTLDALGDFQIRALSSYSIFFCAFVGLLCPALLGMSIIKGNARRFIHLIALMCIAFFVSSLSSALSYSPDNAFIWLTPEVLLAALFAFLAGLLLLTAHHTTQLIWLVLLLPMMLLIINQAPNNPYFAQTLQTWEVGRFVRFHGLAQYIGWFWPYLVLFFAVRTLVEHTRAVQSRRHTG